MLDPLNIWRDALSRVPGSTQSSKIEKYPKHLPQLVRYSDGYQKTILWYMIDPGIRWVVAALNERDYETFNSCEGHPGRNGASYVEFMAHSHKRWEAFVNFAIDYAHPMDMKPTILPNLQRGLRPSFYGGYFDSYVYQVEAAYPWAKAFPENYPPTYWKEMELNLFAVHLDIPSSDIEIDKWNEVRDRFWEWFIHELDEYFMGLK